MIDNKKRIAELKEERYLVLFGVRKETFVAMLAILVAEQEFNKLTEFAKKTERYNKAIYHLEIAKTQTQNQQENGEYNI